jgi:putative FmdB family regulatory protein
MPIYEFECECEKHFDVHLAIADRDTPQTCPVCESGNTKRIIADVNFVLRGDDWPGKAIRINNQMAKKNSKLQIKSDEMKKDEPLMTLAPNVDGERTDSWEDAQKLAGDKGKDTSSYDSYVRKEQSGDI